MQALLAVMDKFRVNNRHNMFVIRETKSGAVFYIRFVAVRLSNKLSNSSKYIFSCWLGWRQEGRLAI